MSAGTPATGTPALKLALPAIAILAIVGGLTLLLAGGSSKQPLPYHASAAKAARYEGLMLTPQRPAPSLGAAESQKPGTVDHPKLGRRFDDRS